MPADNPDPQDRPAKGPAGKVQSDLINFLGLMAGLGIALGVAFGGDEAARRTDALVRGLLILIPLLALGIALLASWVYLSDRKDAAGPIAAKRLRRVRRFAMAEGAFVGAAAIAAIAMISARTLDVYFGILSILIGLLVLVQLGFHLHSERARWFPKGLTALGILAVAAGALGAGIVHLAAGPPAPGAAPSVSWAGVLGAAGWLLIEAVAAIKAVSWRDLKARRFVLHRPERMTMSGDPARRPPPWAALLGFMRALALIGAMALAIRGAGGDVGAGAARVLLGAGTAIAALATVAGMIVGVENFRAKTRGLRGAEDAPETVPEDLGFGGSRREKRRKKQRVRRRAASAPPPSRPRGISALSRAPR